MLLHILSIAGVMGRVCLGAVFVTAAAPKLRHLDIFVGVVSNYRILPRRLASPAARGLAVGELALGVLLAAQIAPVGAALAGMVLLAVFAAAMAINLRRGRSSIDCGCHRSTLRQPLRWSLVWRNAGLILLLAPSLSAPPADTAVAITVGAVAGLAAFLVYLMGNVLTALPIHARSPA